MGVAYFLKELATDKKTKLDSSTFEATKKQSEAKTKEAAEETKPKYKGSTKQ